MLTLSVDIEGLNLVLGGGVPILKRHESFAGESATLVVRGPPGSGKTVLGTQLATSLARQLPVNRDVAYACVELLPSELAAQHAGLERSEGVVLPPFRRQGGTGCIYAGVLDLGTPTDEQARLLPAIEELLDAVRQAGGKPGVVVVDSLSDGYHLGGSVPRPLADEVCKMAAEQGLILVLLEESTSGEQSNWCFAVDLVLELDMRSLSLPGEEAVLQRCLRCSKNRFGPCEPGPHHVEVRAASGVRVYPSPLTYTRPWAVSTVLPGWRPGYPTWRWGALDGLGGSQTMAGLSKYPFNRSVTLVLAAQSPQVAQVAAFIGQSDASSKDVLLSFGTEPGLLQSDITELEHLRVVAVGTLSPADRLAAAAVGGLSRIWTTNRALGRVFIGDLSDMGQRWNPASRLQALATLLHFLKRACLPVILTETAQNPWVSDYISLADIIVSVLGTAAPTWPTVRITRLGTQEQMRGLPPPGPLAAQLSLAM